VQGSKNAKLGSNSLFSKDFYAMKHEDISRVYTVENSDVEEL
jgi:hypothetical protein